MLRFSSLRFGSEHKFLIKYICFSILWNYTPTQHKSSWETWELNGKWEKLDCVLDPSRRSLIPAVCFSSSFLSSPSSYDKTVISTKFSMHLPSHPKHNKVYSLKHILALQPPAKVHKKTFSLISWCGCMCSNFNLEKVVKLSVIWSLCLCVWLIITKCAFIMHTKLLVFQIMYGTRFRK